ncbi:class I SAM-dependent methyltransferase [Mycobacterium sp.]|uniref:class I SAM-dependent methyltransferase n=1 Tax=Mycobacterium sp. TaxID=1785 RepID=UPI002C0181BB|nr:class I SAM-dependent methyltransferase [Mycobacterium sp.]HTY35343.1 class I SAM-dependent methyltransferase [Mycobacterium sp.]
MTVEMSCAKPMFGPEHADVYEVTYRSRGKDWAAEARDVTNLIRRRRPNASSLLDVACGTGAHLETFRTCFEHVEGVEVAPAMRDRAVRRLPGVPIHPQDMRTLDLNHSYDAVTCLCTAVGYLNTVEEMRVVVQRMADHLMVGGMLFVEPWWLPEQYIDHYVGSDLVHDGDRVLARVSYTEKRDRAAHMQVRWLVGDPSGLRSFDIVEVFTLFTREEYLAAFEDAGCTAHYQLGWLTGRGIFVGIRRG